jgi:chaperonin cofactor prefoldin
MANEMEKPVTRGELFGEFLPALMAQLDKRFEQINNRFEQVNNRFEQVNNRFEQITADLKAFVTSELQRHVGAIDERHRVELGALDDKYRDTPARLDAVEGRVDSLEPRVSKLETAKRQRRR